jgi:hypothetical protein
MNGKYAANRMSLLPSIETLPLKPNVRRFNYEKQISTMQAWLKRDFWKSMQKKEFGKSTFHKVTFNPKKYNDAMNIRENEKMIS